MQKIKSKWTYDGGESFKAVDIDPVTSAAGRRPRGPLDRQLTPRRLDLWHCGVARREDAAPSPATSVEESLGNRSVPSFPLAYA
jgi:hypothetical protein